MKEKSSFRFNILVFSAAVFILTSIAYTLWLTQIFPLWSMFIIFVIFLLLFAFIVDIPIDKFKWGAKKTSLLTAGIMIMAAIVTQSAWAIITPSWSFSVATDKSTYRLGEDVKITASIKNTGYITHYFQSWVSDPVLVLIRLRDSKSLIVLYSVWYSSHHEGLTEFSLAPSQPLERDLVWNQTNIANPWFSNQTYVPGMYVITAIIPNTHVGIIDEDPNYALFIAHANINVTSS